MKNTYRIILNGTLIGTTKLEYADAPMGVVFGKINFVDEKYGYDYFKDYCKNNQIEIVSDDENDKIILTSSIDELKIWNDKEIEIKGEGNQITGMDNDGFEITIFGIPYPFYEEEFPHHVKEYGNMFNKN